MPTNKTNLHLRPSIASTPCLVVSGGLLREPPLLPPLRFHETGGDLQFWVSHLTSKCMHMNPAHCEAPSPFYRLAHLRKPLSIDINQILHLDLLIPLTEKGKPYGRCLNYFGHPSPVPCYSCPTETLISPTCAVMLTLTRVLVPLQSFDVTRAASVLTYCR